MKQKLQPVKLYPNQTLILSSHWLENNDTVPTLEDKTWPPDLITLYLKHLMAAAQMSDMISCRSEGGKGVFCLGTDRQAMSWGGQLLSRACHSFQGSTTSHVQHLSLGHRFFLHFSSAIKSHTKLKQAAFSVQVQYSLSNWPQLLITEGQVWQTCYGCSQAQLSTNCTNLSWHMHSMFSLVCGTIIYLLFSPLKCS